MNNREAKINLWLFCLSVFFLIGFIVSFALLTNQMNSMGGGRITDSSPTTNITGQNDSPIANDYELRNNATEYQRDLFNELLQASERYNLVSTDDSLLSYASSIVQNFVADFFTLSNKNSRNDVGGSQFISSDVKDRFLESAINEFYLYLNQHIEAFNSEELPTVSNVNIENVEFSFKLLDIDDDEEEDENDDIFVQSDQEEIRIIVVYATWTFENSTLEYIDEFQNSARFTLIETEDDEIRIHAIEEIQEIEEEPVLLW